MSQADHDLARVHPGGREESGFRLRLLDLPPEAHDLHYDVVSNEYLWFLFHYLFDIPQRPAFDASFTRAWEAYVEVNRTYAEAVREAGSPDAILVDDYHLMRLGAELREGGGPDAPLVYFHHTPWCEPEYMSMLPGWLVPQLLEGLLAHDAVGFHARRWADAFLRCCERLLGASVSQDEVRHNGRTTAVAVAPVPLDVDRLKAQAATDPVERWVERIEDVRHGRTLIIRVDRIDLSKNALRGFLAFEALLERRRSLASEVLFLALQYPSRMKVRQYRTYFASCLEAVQRINERFGEGAPGDEGPLQLHMQDDFARSLAALRLSDTLLVNPVYDGLNLVAKEGAVVNERDGTVILSRNAGVFEELGEATLDVNPFDIEETSEAIERAIDMGQPERSTHAERLRTTAAAGTPEAWARARLRSAGVEL
jgi:trehalose 6-phosphate synthase